jgi:arginase
MTASFSGRRIALLGAPTDSNSSFLRGAAAAPGVIRRALASASGNTSTEHGLTFGESIPVRDCGDLPLAETVVDDTRITEAVVDIQRSGEVPLVLGGDHSISHPVLRAIAQVHGPVHVLHFDAHPDLYESLDGNPRSHASPFARVMERGYASGLTQVGIRTMTRHQQEQADRFGVDVVDMRRLDPRTYQPPRRPVYISLDLDVLDPAFAPGVSHHEPGGLSVRELLTILHRIEGPILGVDLVELNPSRDLHDMTATVAAKLVRELGGLIGRTGR